MKGHKILIPRPLRAEVLECLHAAHRGVNGMSANAHQRLFWPVLDAHIRQTRAQCRSCNRISPSQPKEPLAEPSLPELPSNIPWWTCVISEDTPTSFLLTDTLDGWKLLSCQTQMQKVCSQLRAWFCNYGTPEEQSSDGGPPFQSQEYVQFLSNWGIHRCLSSVYYAQSNGRAEVAVKTAKCILLDNTDSAGRVD